MGNITPATVDYDTVKISFSDIYEPTNEKITKLMQCIELLKSHRNKKFVLINNILPPGDEIYYDYINHILYYYGEKFYNFEVNELEKHLILMTVFDKFEDYKDDNCPDTYGLCTFGTDEYWNVYEKSKMINLNYVYSINYNNKVIEVSSFYEHKHLIESNEQIFDFMCCLDILRTNDIRYNSYELTLNRVYTGLNLREHVQPIIDKLNEENKLAT